MYYAMILISVLFSGVRMFSGDVYRRLRGDSLWISLEYSILASIAGVLLLVPYNGFRIEYTHFTLAVCLFCTALNLTHMFCTFRVLGIINLSLYSMFAMLGNMLLPFVAGILFFGEPLTVGKGICLVFLCTALGLTVQRGGQNRGQLYYILVFLLNGIYAVVNKLYASAALEKASPTGFTILTALCTVAVVPLLMLFLRRKQQAPSRIPFRCLALGLGSGSLTQIAGMLLLTALSHVDASVQYPMVTGGTIIVSTALSYFGQKKPSRRELLSVSLAFTGLLILFLFPH